MGIIKNLAIEAGFFDEGEDELDDFLRNAQADEPGIHQPGLVKSHNLETF